MIRRRSRGIEFGAVNEGAAIPYARIAIYWEPRDLWVGAFVREGGRYRGGALYLCPLPTLVIRISFAPAWSRRG